MLQTLQAAVHYSFFTRKVALRSPFPFKSAATPLAVLLTGHSPENSFEPDYRDDQGLRKKSLKKSSAFKQPFY